MSDSDENVPAQSPQEDITAHPSCSYASSVCTSHHFPSCWCGCGELFHLECFLKHRGDGENRSFQANPRQRYMSYSHDDIKEWKCFHCFQATANYGKRRSDDPNVDSRADTSIERLPPASPYQSSVSSSEPGSPCSISAFFPRGKISTESGDNDEDSNSSSSSEGSGYEFENESFCSYENSGDYEDALSIDGSVQSLHGQGNGDMVSQGVGDLLHEDIPRYSENVEEETEYASHGTIPSFPASKQKGNYETNMFVKVHMYHASSIRCHASRHFTWSGRCNKCDTQCDRLWRCVDCDKCLPTEASCEECITRNHVNKLHNMQFLEYSEDSTNVFLSPTHIKAENFPMIYLVPKMFCGHDIKWEKVKQVCSKTITVVDIRGIFLCRVPSDTVECDNCGYTQEVSPVVFNCLSCEYVRETTWVSREILSLYKHIRARNGDGVYGLCDAFTNFWEEKGSFFSSLPTKDLIDRINGAREEQTVHHERDATESMHLTIKGLAKKMSNCLNIENQLCNSIWMDTNSVQIARHTLQSKCAFCHKTCQQIHIDGNMKMKRLKSTNISVRGARYGQDLFLSSERIKQHMQSDLSTSQAPEAQCGDLEGMFSSYRAGSRNARSDVGASFAQTGLFIAVCPHHNPILTAQMTTRGEPYYLAHAMMNWFEEQPMDVKFYSYDIACMFLAYMRKRDGNLYQQVKDRIVLGYFHGLTHKCRDYNTGFTREGAGYCDGEQSERLNSLLVNYSSFLKYMKEENFVETLSDFFYKEVRKNNMRCHKVIKNKMEAVCKKFCELNKELQACLKNAGLRPSYQEMKLWVSTHTRAPQEVNNKLEQAGKKLEEYVYLKFEKRSIPESREELLRQKESVQKEHQVGSAAKAKVKYLTAALETLDKLAGATKTVSVRKAVGSKTDALKNKKMKKTDT